MSVENLMNFLKQNAVMTIATSGDNKPRSSILEYIMVGDIIMFSTDPESIKSKNIETNKNISISLGGMPIYATIDGIADKPTEAEISEFNQILIARHPEFVDLMKTGQMKPFIYYKIVPDTAYYSDCTNGMTEPVVIALGPGE